MKVFNKERKINSRVSGIFLIGFILLLSFSLPASPAARPFFSLFFPQENQELKELDLVLKALETFDHTQGEGPILSLERLIFKIKDNPKLKLQAERKLLDFLSGPVRREAWVAVSKPLSLIASVESVKTLAPFLTGPEKSDPARYVIERIPGKEAEEALLSALDGASPEIMTGLISSLGHRGAVSSIPALERILNKNSSPVVTLNILEALGNIGGEEAARILMKHLNTSQENLRRVTIDSLLRIACREVEQNPAQAALISDRLLKFSLRPEQRLAAWKVKILSARDNAPGMIQVALKAKENEARRAALELFSELVPLKEIESYLPQFSKFEEKELVQLAAVLAGYPAPAVRQYLIDLASRSSSLEVRTQALDSLGLIGDSSTVEFLVKKATLSSGKEKSAARESLVALRGKEVDEKILQLLATASDQTFKNELLLASLERNIRESRDYFLKEAASPSADLALVARGLRAFGDISLAEELFNIAYKSEDETFREELAGLMAAWARQSARPGARSSFFRNLLNAEKLPPRQALLISIIGKIGERNSLPWLRNYLKIQEPEIREAVIKALAEWPEVEARDDLMLIARSSSNLKEKVLAIRGLVRLTASERYRKPEAVVETLKEIFSLCPRAEEKKLVLSVFPEFPCQTGLEFCQSLANDPEVGAEALTALDKIKRRL